jgi:hypothetical protein
MSYLFIKNLFQKKKSLYYYFQKNFKLKKKKKTTFSGFFWVGFILLPTLPEADGLVGGLAGLALDDLVDLLQLFVLLSQVGFPLLRDFQPFLKDLHLFVFLHDFLLNKRFRDFFQRVLFTTKMQFEEG